MRGVIGLATIVALAAGAILVPPSASAAPPSLLTKFCLPGEATGNCKLPSPGGLVSDPDSGAIYIADSGNRRVEKFGPWGEFLLAWGWGVRTGANQPQTCGPEAEPPSATCEPGQATDSAGGFDQSLASIAIDSQGHIYTYEGGTAVGGGNFRVQKFEPDGDFVLEFGGEVNETTGADVCTAASGHDCGPGVEGFTPGYFAPGYVCDGPGSCQVGPNWAQSISIAAGDRVFLGDRERIQVFSASGEYMEQIPLPGEVVKSLAVDGDGNMFIVLQPETTAAGGPVFRGLPNVQKLAPDGTSVCSAEISNPLTVAVDSDGNLYATQRPQIPGNVGVLKFGPDCTRVDLGAPEPGFGSDVLTFGGGLATSEACGVDGVQVLATNARSTVGENHSFATIFGPPADPALCPPPAVPPDIADQFATAVDTTTARVAAKINPRFWPDARFYVEYGTESCSEGGCQLRQPAPPGMPLTEAVVNAEVRTPDVILGDLEPGTVYHYRFVAESSGGTETGPERTLRTYQRPAAPKSDCANQALRVGLSRALPNCRAYEMVSPVDKNNGDIDSTGAQGLSLGSADGERATFSSFRAFADPQGAPFSNQYLAERGGDGWRTRSISAPRESVSMYQGGSAAASTHFKSFDPDLCSAWMVQDSRIALAPGAPADVPNLYRRHNCAGVAVDSYSLLTTVPPPGYAYEPNSSRYFPDPQGASADGTRTVFRAPAKLTANACATKGILQVYEQIEGEGLHLVSLRPNNQPVCTHSSAGTPQGLAGELRRSVLHNAVSDDGRRVFWTASNNSDPELPGTGHVTFTGTLYLRANVGGTPVTGEGCLNSSQSCTIRVSERVSEQPARFWDADREGSAAIFSVGETLYRFGTEPAPAVSEVAKGLVGVMGASEDARRIYFVSTEALTGPQANSQGDVAQAGEPNLYLFEVGAGATFVATLSSVDTEPAGGTLFSASPSPIAVLPDRRTSRVSADGLHAAFTSTAALTGADNLDLESGEPAAEVFLYDAEPGGSGELACVSCNPSGVRPSAQRFVTVRTAARIPGWSEQLRPTRALSDDGDRLFFESFEQLVLRDTNRSRDVYQWERAADEQQCIQQQGGELFVAESGGCLSLVSSGTGSEDTAFIDASSTGSDVLIGTNASLVAQDPGLFDIYDAREGGGFPPPPAEPAPCQGAACQSPAPPPSDPAPASSAFSGPGNLKRPHKPRRCAKGKRKVKRGGKTRCVKVKKKSRKAKKRSARHGRRAVR